jgi:hypothetical protein
MKHPNRVFVFVLKVSYNILQHTLLRPSARAIGPSRQELVGCKAKKNNLLQLQFLKKYLGPKLPFIGLVTLWFCQNSY